MCYKQRIDWTKVKARTMVDSCETEVGGCLQICVAWRERSKEEQVVLLDTGQCVVLLVVTECLITG